MTHRPLTSDRPAPPSAPPRAQDWIGYLVPGFGADGFHWDQAKVLRPMSEIQARQMVIVMDLNRGYSKAGLFIFGPNGEVVQSKPKAGG